MARGAGARGGVIWAEPTREPHNRALYASEPEFPPFELGCCDATADTTVHLLPCLASFQGGADKKGSPKRCEMVAAGTAAG